MESDETDVAPVAQLRRADDTLSSTDLDQQLNRRITNILLQHMPHTYTDDKRWGMQSDRFDGVRVRREGFRIKTKRKKKKVNHGRWRRYDVSLANPAETFSVEIHNLRSANGQTHFDLNLSTDVNLTVRQSKWVKGVQAYSISADGSATLHLQVQCSLGIRYNFDAPTPTITLSPLVSDARIVVENFRIDRVSKAGGELAQQMTRVVENKMTDKMERYNKKLVNKLNTAIERKRDSLTVSLETAASSKWFGVLTRVGDETTSTRAPSNDAPDAPRRTVTAPKNEGS